MVEYLQNVMEPDSLVSSHPVYLTIDDPLSIAQLFDDITYNKVIFYRISMVFFPTATLAYANKIANFMTGVHTNFIITVINVY